MTGKDLINFITNNNLEDFDVYWFSADDNDYLEEDEDDIYVNYEEEWFGL